MGIIQWMANHIEIVQWALHTTLIIAVGVIGHYSIRDL